MVISDWEAFFILIMFVFLGFSTLIKLDALQKELRGIRKELEKTNAEEWDFRE